MNAVGRPAAAVKLRPSGIRTAVADGAVTRPACSQGGLSITLSPGPNRTLGARRTTTPGGLEAERRRGTCSAPVSSACCFSRPRALSTSLKLRPAHEPAPGPRLPAARVLGWGDPEAGEARAAARRQLDVVVAWRRGGGGHDPAHVPRAAAVGDLELLGLTGEALGEERALVPAGVQVDQGDPVARQLAPHRLPESPQRGRRQAAAVIGQVPWQQLGALGNQPEPLIAPNPCSSSAASSPSSRR